MKTKVIFLFASFFFTFLLVSFSDPYTIKRISDANFRYEFYTTAKKVTLKPNVIYYWFKGGLIHSAQSGMAGELLDDTFLKMYHSNQLAEKGQFSNGIKTGQWTTWHPNGIIAITQTWYDGLPYGNYRHYDENGALVEKGKYRKGLKTGRWINYVKKDTLEYKKGNIVIKKPSLSKAEKYKQKQDLRKEKEALQAQQKANAAKEAALLDSYKANDQAEKEKSEAVKQTIKENKKAEKEREKAANKTEHQEATAKKESGIQRFFKKLFHKKEPKPKTNGKSA